MFFKVMNKKKYTIKKGDLKGSLAFMHQLKFVIWLFRFLVSNVCLSNKGHQYQFEL